MLPEPATEQRCAQAHSTPALPTGQQADRRLRGADSSTSQGSQEEAMVKWVHQ